MNLSAEEVRALLQRAVDEKGADYVYPDEDLRDTLGSGVPICQYFVDGAPSCIVGHVLHYAGVDEAQEGSSGFDVARDITENLDVRDALAAAQNVQDAGGTWGEALAAYDEYMRNRGE